MKNYLKNKTALITGASSGIGKQVAKDLAKMKVNLVLLARNKEKLEKLKEKLQKKYEIKIEVFALDVSLKKDIKEVIPKILQNNIIDILFNNAGLALGLQKIEEGSLEDFDEMIDVNIKGLLYMSAALIPQMKALDTAHIINMGSVAGKTAYPNGNVYCATKAAVHSITDSLNADLLGTNIKVSTIAPGAVKTNFSNIRFKGDEKKAQNVYAGYKPLYAKDISQAIINILNTPKHVNIQYLDIMPIAQRNPFLIHKI